MLVKPPIEVALAEPGDNLPVPFTTWLQKYLSGRKVEGMAQLTWENAEEFTNNRIKMIGLATRRNKE